MFEKYHVLCLSETKDKLKPQGQGQSHKAKPHFFKDGLSQSEIPLALLC